MIESTVGAAAPRSQPGGRAGRAAVCERFEEHSIIGAAASRSIRSSVLQHRGAFYHRCCSIEEHPIIGAAASRSIRSSVPAPRELAEVESQLEAVRGSYNGLRNSRWGYFNCIRLFLDEKRKSRCPIRMQGYGLVGCNAGCVEWAEHSTLACGTNRVKNWCAVILVLTVLASTFLVLFVLYAVENASAHTF